MHPRLARAMINLSGKTSGMILDPFCGSGGLLVEALFLGFEVTGIDNDQTMIQRCEVNLRHYGFPQENYKLLFQDALIYTKKADAVVADVPYGKNTKGRDLGRLYFHFLQHYRTLTSVMVVGFPHFILVEPLIKKTNWKISAEFEYYLHKSLSKKIYVLSRRYSRSPRLSNT